MTVQESIAINQVNQILYLGDTSLQTAASYLAGLLTLNGWRFRYVPSQQPLTAAHLQDDYQLYIISDYSAKNISNELQREIATRVSAGANLLMIGGWESFQGLDGGWQGTPIAELLPVTISEGDDRQNCSFPVFIDCLVPNHPIVFSLPFTEQPPLIGGFNRVTARPDATAILNGVSHRASKTDDGYVLQPERTDPILVVSEQSSGSRVAAFTTDVAPHWIGTWIDWGKHRVQALATDSEAVEVGHLYSQFISQLIGWVGQFEEVDRQAD